MKFFEQKLKQLQSLFVSTKISIFLSIFIKWLICRPSNANENLHDMAIIEDPRFEGTTWDLSDSLGLKSQMKNSVGDFSWFTNKSKHDNLLIMYNQIIRILLYLIFVKLAFCYSGNTY